MNVTTSMFNLRISGTLDVGMKRTVIGFLQYRQQNTIFLKIPKTLSSGHCDIFRVYGIGTNVYARDHTLRLKLMQ